MKKMSLPGMRTLTVFKESRGFHYLIQVVDSAAQLNTYTSRTNY